MTIELYAYDTPNGRKISVALEEMQLPYVVRIINLAQGAQFEPALREISPNCKIPAIVDSHGVGGVQRVFESGAILVYLGEKSGKFWPVEPPARIAVLEWLFFQVGGFGPIPGQVHHFAQLHDPAERDYGLTRFLGETHRLYATMDRWLSEHRYFAGEISIADFAIVAWVWRHERHQVDLHKYPNVALWYQTMMARPGVQRGFSAKLK